MGLKAESVSGATHLRVEGCGRKGLISHWGFLTEPLGGFRERWQRVPAGSEERGVGHTLSYGSDKRELDLKETY